MEEGSDLEEIRVKVEKSKAVDVIEKIMRFDGVRNVGRNGMSISLDSIELST